MRSTESGFSPNVYLAAAKERLQTAQKLLGGTPPDYVGASYFAGAEDTARHDVRQQAAEVGFYDGMTRREQSRVGGLVAEVAARWRNNHRYRSETALRTFITRERPFVISGNKTTRQDALVFSTARLVDTSAQIIEIGKNQWQSLPNL